MYFSDCITYNSLQIYHLKNLTDRLQSYHMKSLTDRLQSYHLKDLTDRLQSYHPKDLTDRQSVTVPYHYHFLRTFLYDLTSVSL